MGFRLGNLGLRFRVYKGCESPGLLCKRPKPKPKPARPFQDPCSNPVTLNPFTLYQYPHSCYNPKPVPPNPHMSNPKPQTFNFLSPCSSPQKGAPVQGVALQPACQAIPLLFGLGFEAVGVGFKV